MIGAARSPPGRIRAVSTLALTIVALLAAGSGTVVGTRRAGSGRVGAAAVVSAGVDAAGIGVLGLLATVVTKGPFAVFAFAHLLYLGLTVSIPLLAVGLGVAAVRRGAPLAVWGLLVSALLPAPVGIYATHVEPYDLRVDRHVVPIDSDRAGDDEVRIAVLADLQTNHVGEHEQRAVDEVLRSDPDLILIPGDLFQGTVAERADQRDAMRASSAAWRHRTGCGSCGVTPMAGEPATARAPSTTCSTGSTSRS